MIWVMLTLDIVGVEAVHYSLSWLQGNRLDSWEGVLGKKRCSIWNVYLLDESVAPERLRYRLQHQPLVFSPKTTLLDHP
jgi:hypothetical protein